MVCSRRSLGLVLGIVCLATDPAAAADPPPQAEYFRTQTEALSARPLQGIDSAVAWRARRPELQRQLLDMLGLWPPPERTDLAPRITGTVEEPDFVVEKLLFQSRPGLYVTANLYRPRDVPLPLPAILYLCGHGRMEKDGVIYGCKTHYQHHAAWYAANGYVCLVLDTLELGEIPGIHHGTYREGMWWWQSRGYTPAGVEAWNALRGIDYLISRPEVDRARIGVTGRSGGGATSWWVGAIDDRVAAVVAVAGITDLKNHVVDGVVEGHCDCMYFANTHRWDFPLVAALVAPRPLLVENTDHDPIFPEDGVRRIYAQLETVFRWYGASDKLGLVIGKGGHIDSEEIRHPSFAFFNRWLKGKDEPVVEPSRPVALERLKVLEPGEKPPPNRNATIQETFIARATLPGVPLDEAGWEGLRARWLEELKARTFGGWPEVTPAENPKAKVLADHPNQGASAKVFEFESQPGVRLHLWLVVPEDQLKRPHPLVVTLLDEPSWRRTFGDRLTALEHNEWKDGGQGDDPLSRILGERANENCCLAFVAPRGIGPSAWPRNKDTQVRRRFALLGQTLDAMRVWDARRALALLRAQGELEGSPIHLMGRGEAASWALWTAVFEPDVAEVTLIEPPRTFRDGPAYPNVERVFEMPQAVGLLFPRPVSIVGGERDDWAWPRDLAAKLAPAKAWPRFRALPTAPEPGR